MKALDRKLLRDLRAAKGQAIAVTMVIVCGVASLVCVLSAYWDLGATRDAYYRSYRFGDFWAPLERAPLRAVREVEAVPARLRRPPKSPMSARPPFLRAPYLRSERFFKGDRS